MGSPYVLPQLAIVDPELMLSAPKQLTVNTGLDVFCHAVEAYTSTAASDLSDMYAEKALTLVGKHMETCCEEGRQFGSSFRNGHWRILVQELQFCNGVVTLAHVMAHVIGGHFSDIPHGDALYSIYSETLKFNSQALAEKHKFIANAIDPGNDDVVSAFEKFFGKFEFANKLKDKFQENPEIVNTIAEDTFTYMKGIAELNPVAATEEDAKNILSASLK